MDVLAVDLTRDASGGLDFVGLVLILTAMGGFLWRQTKTFLRELSSQRDDSAAERTEARKETQTFLYNHMSTMTAALERNAQSLDNVAERLAQLTSEAQRAHMQAEQRKEDDA